MQAVRPAQKPKQNIATAGEFHALTLYCQNLAGRLARLCHGSEK
jgi:hypothetical protein